MGDIKADDEPGDVVLHNLRLKREALDKFNLPVDVLEGFLGDLTISIPWNDLKTKPVRVRINNMFLLVAPKADSDFDPDLEDERAFKAKMERVEAAELLNAKDKLPDDKQNNTFVTQLITKIVDNLQIHVQNIHIRYEDKSREIPLSVGITLSEFSAASTDENWNEAFIHEEVGLIHKLVRLESLAVYFNTEAKTLAGMSIEEAIKVLSQMIASETNIPDHNRYILKPVSGQGKIRINKAPKTREPRYSGILDFDEFGFVVTDKQYASFLSLTRSFATFVKAQKYRKFKPPRSITPLIDPLAWFKFAGTCVLYDIHERNKKWTWNYFAERRDNRVLYIKLFKASKSASNPALFSPEDAELIKILERRLSFEDIRFYRSIANNQLRKEKAIKSATSPSAAEPPSTTIGWLTSFWGTTEASVSRNRCVQSHRLLQPSGKADEVAFTDDQMKKLMDTIEYDPQASLLDADVPKDTVLLHLEWALKKGSLALKKGDAKQDFISVVFDKFTAVIDQLPASIVGNVSLGGMTRPFFSLDFEHNPLDERADEAISLKMLPLQVVMNPNAVNGVTDFFAVPNSELEAITAIKSVAQGITAQTRAGLEYALSKHRTLDAKIDIAAPIFVLPESCVDKKATVVVVDAGHLNVESNLVSKDDKKEIESKQGSEFTESDFLKLKSLLYDRFTCVLKSVQVVVGPSLESCLIEVSDASNNTHLHFLERADVSFNVELSILPKLSNHIKTIITGKLPRLHLNMSDRKYKSFMRILDIVTRRPQTAVPSSNSTIHAENHWMQQGKSDLLLPSDDEDDSFFDAEESIHQKSSSQPSQEVAPDAILMQFVFEIGQVSAALRKSDLDPSQNSKVLADLKMTGFNLVYNTRPHDYNVTIHINSIAIEDKLELHGRSLNETRFLLSPSLSTSAMKEEHLMRISYVSRKPTSPEYCGVDQDIKVSFASVDLNLVKESVLYLYDFVLYTFTTVEASKQAEALMRQESGIASPVVIQQPFVSPSVMVVHVDFTSVNFLVNQNNARVATASFGNLNLKVTFKGGRMFVNGRLGNLSIVDDVIRSENARASRQLLKIEGSEVADFFYETFSPLLPDYPGYDSFLKLRAASARITFMEPLLNELSSFLSEFLKMHMLMDAARKAIEYQEVNARSKYDLDIESPIIEFPDSTHKSDKTMLMYLGRIVTKNDFFIATDGSVSNKIAADILSMKLRSNFPADDSEGLGELMEDVNIHVLCHFLKSAVETIVPPSQIAISTNEVKLKLTSRQYKFVLEILDAVGKFFGGPKKQSEEQASSGQRMDPQASSTSLAPVILSDLLCKIPSIALEICDENSSHGAWREESIAQFVISQFQYQSMSNSLQESETEIHIKCLNIFDTRSDGDNLFREIMPSLIRNDDQFSLKIRRDKFGAANYVASLDTFKFILVMDHLFLMRQFFAAPFGINKAETAKNETGLIEGMYEFEELDRFKYRINIVDVEIVLLQDPKVRNSEAIILLGKELVVSYDLVTTLSTKDMGMFFCVMDNRIATTLRFIQNFDLTFVMDSRLSAPGHQLTAINVDISPLMLRVSFQDIRLIQDIFNKATSLGGTRSDEGPAKAESGIRNVSGIIMAREKIQVSTQGIRIILIDDLNDLQLPMYDFVIDKLFFEVSDWSTAMRVDTGLKLHVNNFNVKNSHWEPLIEGFEFYLNVSRENDKLSVDIYSQKKLELNVSHVFVESTLNTMALLSKQSANRASRKTGSAPYVLRNKTGYSMTLWMESSGDGLDTVLQDLKNNEEIPWRFDDWRVMRENVSPTPNKLSIQMHGQEWETLKAIPVDREGIKTYILRPSVNRIAHRLVCEVKMRNNIKVVTFRSTSVVQNLTGLQVDVMVVNAKGQMTSGIYTFEQVPGDECCVPIESSYSDKIYVRPQESFGYNWSNEVLFWKDLQSEEMRGPSLISCSSKDRSTAAFGFQVNVVQPYENVTLVSLNYPFLTMKLLPPFQLENLLPYDFRYVVYDKDSRQEHRGSLAKGQVDPIHTVNPTHSLLLSIELLGIDFKPSEVAILSNAEVDYRDEQVILKDSEDQELQLRIKYSDNLEYGGRKVSIYSPYVLLNRTGLDMYFCARSLIASPRLAAGQETDRLIQAAPFMFSYSNFEPLRNRALVKVTDSDWSKPISFEAVGSSFDIMIPCNNKDQEAHLGIRVNEGEGKYFLSKVVTFTPRFMVKNNIGEDLHCRQGAKQQPLLIKSKSSMPLIYFTEGVPRQLSLRLAGLMDEWSFPFNIDQVGRTYIKLSQMGTSDEELIRAEVVLENATLFIIFSREEGRWPIRIENKSDIDVQFGQYNAKKKYELPVGLSCPYSWDNPSLAVKAIVLSVNGRERQIDIREIGQLLPFKYPNPDGSGRAGIMSIQVYAEGPTLVISLGNYNESKSVYKRLSTRKGSLSSSTTSEIKENMTVQIRLEGIGISVIDKGVKELLYASAKNIEFAYVDTSMAQSITFSINWLQIDNQLYGSLDPIFMYPSVLPKEGEESFHPVLMASLSKSKDSSYGVDFYNWFTILLQEISIDLDEDFLYALINFAKFEVPGWEKVDVQMFDSMTIPEPKSTDADTRMYFEKFLLQPVQFNISFQRTQGGNVDISRESRNVLTFLFDVFTMTVGNIHDAPIRLNALEIYHPIVTLSQLVDLMLTFYSQEIVGQLHKVIGSADFLGNPVGLFNNVGSGVKDFFYEPIQGFEITRPQDFGIGLAKGTSSLLKKTVYGVSDTLSKFTGSVSKGLAVITLDEEYQQKRRLNSARNRPKHALYGVTSGVASFGSSVASGLTGVLSKPVEGFSKDGVGGFFKGLGKGLVGVVSKPVIGVFDLASNVSEGIRNTTTVFDKELEKIRLPRFVSKDGILTQPYDSREAMGLKLLKGLENGRYFKEDYFAHLELRMEDLIVFVTSCRVLLAKARSGRVDWEITFDDLQLVRIDNGGITLIKKGSQQARARIIPCPDQASAQVFVKINAE
ncbi:hypothetical protein BC830DRAFT_1069804 [Chytriomyces sp. MP71]|nr:hypothetical protein BC830DRAFT_1069804 [Chytriomyces sp. MP71]